MDSNPSQGPDTCMSPPSDLQNPMTMDMLESMPTHTEVKELSMDTVEKKIPSTSCHKPLFLVGLFVLLPMLVGVVVKLLVPNDVSGFPATNEDELVAKNLNLPVLSSMLPCEPSFGICASNFEELGRLNLALQPGDTLAICGDIQVESPVEVVEPDVTICCAEGSRCSLQSGGSQVLIVRAANVILRGLSFERGAALDDKGGNVMVQAGGYLEIANCAFTDGSAKTGGNLHVEGSDSVLITNSLFEFGTAENGGGIAIANTPEIVIQESYFDFNRCSNQGGGLLVYSTQSSSVSTTSVSLSTNRFTSNGAGRGAGFYLRNVADYLRLRVKDSYFGQNEADIQGGVGFILHEDASLNAVLSGNIGQDNTAVSGTCSSLFLVPFPNSASERASDCRSIDDSIVYLPEGETLEPTTVPSAAPIPTAPTPACTPSSGFCAEAYEEFDRLALTVAAGDTIALCGIIAMPVPVTIDQPDVTICCADGSRCVLQGVGGQNLILKGANPTVLGVEFQGGSTADEKGGNLWVKADGHVEISNCAFTGGNAVTGGNVHIESPGSVLISNSIFANGTSEFGAGLSIRNGLNVTIQESYFESNRCGSEGGGLYVYSSTSFAQDTHTLSMTLNSFTSNSANRGGAFYLRNLGNLLTFRMSNSYFADNGAAVEGGEGFVLQNATVDILLTDNIAEDNVVVKGDCGGVFFRPFPNTISGSDCKSLDEDISY